MDATASESPFPRLSPDGDSAIRIEFGTTIDPAVNRRVHRFCAAVDAAQIPGIVEWVPAYATATIYYDPVKAEYTDISAQLQELANADRAEDEGQIGRLLEIPVAYGGECGPDLDRVADMHGLTPRNVIDLHCGSTYLCYMIGFTPGFPYLGEVPEKIRTPRLTTPRTRVPAGSVAIAEAQTGIYPQDTPGGWNIIGRTSMRLFDPVADPPALVRPGDTVRFIPIDHG